MTNEIVGDELIIGEIYSDTSPNLMHHGFEAFEYLGFDEICQYFKPCSKKTGYAKLSDGTVPFLKNTKFYKIDLNQY